MFKYISLWVYIDCVMGDFFELFVVFFMLHTQTKHTHTHTCEMANCYAFGMNGFQIYRFMHFTRILAESNECFVCALFLSSQLFVDFTLNKSRQALPHSFDEIVFKIPIRSAVRLLFSVSFSSLTNSSIMVFFFFIFGIFADMLHMHEHSPMLNGIWFKMSFDGHSANGIMNKNDHTNMQCNEWDVYGADGKKVVTTSFVPPRKQ